MARVILALVVCLMSINIASASSKHMVCKQLDDVFSADDNPEHNLGIRGPVSRQGRPGKLGPKGDKGNDGVKGNIGLPGTVDYGRISNEIDEKFASVTETLLSRIDQLGNQLQELNASVTILEYMSCEEGVTYKGKCYFAIIGSTNVPNGKQKCRGRGGSIAELLNGEHQTLVQKYIRGIMSGSSIDIWTGLKYDSTTRTVRLSNGNTIASLRWYPNNPSGSSTGIAFNVKKDESSRRQGGFTYGEARNLNGVLCVF